VKGWGAGRTAAAATVAFGLLDELHLLGFITLLISLRGEDFKFVFP
jgi:hypothetical protein